MSPDGDRQFLARLQRLIRDIPGADEEAASRDGQRREALAEGYGRALALEGERRRLHERQLDLADLTESDADIPRELASLTRREAGLVRHERELRELLRRLKWLTERDVSRANRDSGAQLSSVCKLSETQ